MKLFTDMSVDVAGEVELNESSSEKTYVIKGIFSSPGVKNRNGRVYPMNIWESNVVRYQQEIKNNSINTLAELEHPPRSTVDPWLAVAKTRLLEMRDGKVYGEMEILNNGSKETNQLKALIDAGISIGVSTRGVGRLGKGQMVEEYQLITTDIVSNPSDYGANLTGFSESLIMEDANFGIEEGNVVCTPEGGCALEEAQAAEVTEEVETPEVKEPKETLCAQRAKALIESFSSYTTDKVELTEKEIKAFDIIALYEKKPTYKELQKKIADSRKELKKYKKGSDEYEALTFEIDGYEEYLAKTLSKGRPGKAMDEEEIDEAKKPKVVTPGVARNMWFDINQSFVWSGSIWMEGFPKNEVKKLNNAANKITEFFYNTDAGLNEAQVNDFGKLSSDIFKKTLEENMGREGKAIIEDGEESSDTVILSIDKNQFTVFYTKMGLIGVTHATKGQKSMLLKKDEIKILKKAI